MLAVAIGWQVYSIHRNPLDLGLVGLMEFVPLPLLALPAGQLADRLPRRAVTAAAFTLNIAIAVLLVFVTLAGATRLWPFLGVAALAGVANVVGNPAARAMTPEIVPTELVPSAPRAARDRRPGRSDRGAWRSAASSSRSSRSRSTSPPPGS